MCPDFGAALAKRCICADLFEVPVRVEQRLDVSAAGDAVDSLRHTVGESLGAGIDHHSAAAIEPDDDIPAETLDYAQALVQNGNAGIVLGAGSERSEAESRDGSCQKVSAIETRTA
jgi:hypothetical protein